MNFIKLIIFSIAIFFIAFEGVFTYTSTDRAFELLFFIFLIPAFRADFKENEIINLTAKLLMAFAFFVLLRIFMVFVLELDMDTTITRDFVRILFILVIFYILYYMFTTNYNVLYWILTINFFIMLVAFFEAEITPLTDMAWEFKYRYFEANSKGFEDTITFRKRVVGLYGTAVPLAYILASNMVLSIYLYIKTNKSFFILYYVFLGIIAVFTLTRSVLITWAILLVYLAYIRFFKETFKRKIISIFFLFAIIVGIGNWYYQNVSSVQQFNRVTNIEDSSAQGRTPLMITGLYTLVRHPFGHSKDEYMERKIEMNAIYHNHHILEFPSHNGLINIGFKYTIFGLLLFIAYLFQLRKILKKTIPPELVTFFTVGFFAYLANGFFHNNFMFIEDFYALIILALIAYEYESHKQIKVREEIENEK